MQVPIAMDFWPEDAGCATPPWDEVLRTPKPGQYISDPTPAGPEEPSDPPP